MQRRLAIPLGACLLALAVLPATALSEGPTKESTSLGGPRVFAAGTACPFTMMREWLIDQGTAKVFPADKNGDVKVLISGKAVVRYTNLDNGKSLTADVSGPLHVTLHPDGSETGVLLGHGTDFFYPTDTPPGPFTFINFGRVVIFTTGAPNFDFTLVIQSGNLLNVCTALA